MNVFQRFLHNHADMFVPRAATHVYPHDYFVARTFLRFVPKSITPNKITMFRILATPVVFLVTFFQFYELGIILFILIAATDVLDGSMARTQNYVTEFGILFDPIADKFLIGSLILLIVFDNYDPWIGLVVLGLEIVFIISAAVYKIRFHSARMANAWGKLKMFAQVIAVFITLAGLLLNAPQFFVVGAWVFGVAIGFALMSLFFHGV